MRKLIKIKVAILFAMILLSCGGEFGKSEVSIKKSIKSNRKPICGCFLVCKMKGNERISSWNEYACDDRGYEYIGYPENVIKDRYLKVFKGTEYTITTSKVSDTYCD